MIIHYKKILVPVFPEAKTVVGTVLAYDCCNKLKQEWKDAAMEEEALHREGEKRVAVVRFGKEDIAPKEVENFFAHEGLRSATLAELCLFFHQRKDEEPFLPLLALGTVWDREGWPTSPELVYHQYRSRRLGGVMVFGNGISFHWWKVGFSGAEWFLGI